MSEVISVKAVNTVSPLLRSINSVSMADDIRPAMRSSEQLVKDILHAHIMGSGYNLAEHARKGVLSKAWDMKTTTSTFGFTVYLSPREWLYIFNGGTYKTGVRKTKKTYKTGPYTDSLGRHYKERSYKAGVRRGAIPAGGYLDSTRRDVEGFIFNKLRSDINRAVETKLRRSL